MDASRTLYVSTERGLMRGSLNGTLTDLRPLGLERYGRSWTVVVDHRNPHRLYVGTTRGGVFRSDDGGETWQKKSEGLYFQEVSCVVQHPLTGEIYAGTRPASVFKSSDYGENWTNCDGLHHLEGMEHWTFPHAPFFPHVKAIGLSPANPKLILGAIEEGWLVRSTDGGATWTNLTDGPEFDSHTVYTMPDNEKVLVSTSGKGVYRSEDGGEHFTPANEGLHSRYLAQLAFHPEAPQLLFTAGAEVPPPGWRRPEGCRSQIYRSDNQGRRWQALKGGLPNDIRAAPRVVAGDSQAAGWVMVGMQDGDLWLSRDFGDSFQRVAAGLPAVFGIASVAT
jgi:photosystem II stability/assembly factor-like uncharacterized protein